MDELQIKAAALVKKIREQTINSILNVKIGDRALRECQLSEIKARAHRDITIGEIIELATDKAFSDDPVKVIDLKAPRIK